MRISLATSTQVGPASGHELQQQEHSAVAEEGGQPVAEVERGVRLQVPEGQEVRQRGVRPQALVGQQAGQKREQVQQPPLRTSH